LFRGELPTRERTWDVVAALLVLFLMGGLLAWSAFSRTTSSPTLGRSSTTAPTSSIAPSTAASGPLVAAAENAGCRKDEPGENEANLDDAVDTSEAPWCTSVHHAPLALPITVEGWFRSTAPKAGALLEISDGKEGWLTVFVAVGGRVEVRAGSKGLGGLPSKVGVWTHFRLSLREKGASLTLWDYEGDERDLRLSGDFAPRGVAQRICLGGSARPGGTFQGWLDEVRVWSTSLNEAVARAWRHRRLSAWHPARNALLGYWPFRDGRSEDSVLTASLGPVKSDKPRWVRLPRLSYGPVLRAVHQGHARFLFGADSAPQSEGWSAGLELWAGGSRDVRRLPPRMVSRETDDVAHIEVANLNSQTVYRYVPMIEGRRAMDGPSEALPAFTTPPELGERNADFTADFLADQHTPNGPEATCLEAYGVALRDSPLFWAQLGDVVPGALDSKTAEHKRDRSMLRGLWERNYGSWSLPQARLARSVPLNMATISDHEIENNYDLNWHLFAYGRAPSPEESTLADRLTQYNLSMRSWWSHFGWGWPQDDRLGLVARKDFGAAAQGVGYETPGLYHSYRPYPYVEFLVLDTSSYRGDTYQRRQLFARQANSDRDHSRYPWSSAAGPLYIFGDTRHGANVVTDSVRSWLGPAQREAFLAAIRTSRAKILVIVAGYPLYSFKFERSELYWPARESGFDFASEAAEILETLESADRLVLWVHGDGHSPALVRLRQSVYQLQTGATYLAGPAVGHTPRSFGPGERGREDLLGGGVLMGGHQPDLRPGDDSADVFLGGLDQFEGYLRLYFHPGQEALRNSEDASPRRGGSNFEIEIPTPVDPAKGAAAQAVVDKVMRIRYGNRVLFSPVAGYRFKNGAAVFRLRDPIVTVDPQEVRILVDGVPWVEARWFDVRGHEWRDLGAVLRREPAQNESAPGQRPVE